jgi:hypothetical protein
MGAGVMSSLNVQGEPDDSKMRLARKRRKRDDCSTNVQLQQNLLSNPSGIIAEI